MHGWSAERRRRQGLAIRIWSPWERSTGPKSVSGKAKSRMNAWKHGARGAAVRHLAKLLRKRVDSS
jgi:hypothetical protein